jgi:small subunit ribosomal protein S13
MSYFFEIIKKNLELKKELKKIYGVGKLASLRIYAELGLSKNFSAKQYNNLNSKWYKKYMDLDEQIFGNLDKLLNKTLMTHELFALRARVDDKSYKGVRHTNNLPVRGQRTHTNRKTQRFLTVQRHQNLKNLLATKEKK